MWLPLTATTGSSATRSIANFSFTCMTMVGRDDADGGGQSHQQNLYTYLHTCFSLSKPNQSSSDQVQTEGAGHPKVYINLDKPDINVCGY